MNLPKNLTAERWIGIPRAIVYATIVLANYLADRLTKLLAVHFLKDSTPIRFLDNLAILTYAENDGAFLGMGGTWPPAVKGFVFIILPLLACAAAIIYAYRKTTRTRQAVSILFILGGGIGNLQDRILNNGLVVDFMNFGIGGLRTGILNVGDLSVTFGALALAALSIREEMGRT